MKILGCVLIAAVLFGCVTINDPRLVGTFVSDKEATMTYLEGSGKFTERQLKLFAHLLGKLRVECDGVTVVSKLDAFTETEPLKILTTTKDYALVESEVLGEPMQYKIIFTEDGYWVAGGIAGPDYREKFVKLPTRRVQP